MYIRVAFPSPDLLSLFPLSRGVPLYVQSKTHRAQCYVIIMTILVFDELWDSVIVTALDFKSRLIDIIVIFRPWCSTLSAGLVLYQRAALRRDSIYTQKAVTPSHTLSIGKILFCKFPFCLFSTGFCSLQSCAHYPLSYGIVRSGTLT